MANLTTTDNTKTPVLHEVNIYYEIDTPILLEDYTYESWIDLNHYFADLDTDDTLIFNHSDVSNIDITIDQDDYTVRLAPDADWYGTRIIRFSANDSYSIAYSNNITIIVEDVIDEAPTTITITSGGGGGGATRTKIKKVLEYEYTRLLVPGPVSVIEPNKVKIPIIVENNINQPLKEIYLSAVSEEGISLEFDTLFIDEIDIKDKKIVNLFATAIDRNKPYTITINAKVTTPSLNDSTIVQINPLENMTVKVKTVMDLLKTHPECLELNELVINAKKSIDNKEYVKANNLLEEALRSCRFIRAKKEEEKLAPVQIKIKGLVLWGIIILIIIGAVASFYLIKRKRSKIIKKKNEGGE